MNEVSVTKECTRLDRWLTAYADNELDAVHALEVEDHLTACEGCNERVLWDRAVRTSLRQTKPVASASLRQRAAAALLAEAVIVAASSPSPEGLSPPSAARPSSDQANDASPRAAAPKLVRLRYVAPLAVAAALALILGGLQLRDPRTVFSFAPVPTGSSASDASQQPPGGVQLASTFDRFIDELVDSHIQPAPPEVTDDDGLTRLNPFVGVRVPRPELSALGARYLGARMHRRHAAMLQYATGDRRRMTLYVFNPARVPVQANRLKSRMVGNSHVYLGHVRGYAVAASERDGVGYALASDLSDKETEEAIVMAAR